MYESNSNSDSSWWIEVYPPTAREGARGKINLCSGGFVKTTLGHAWAASVAVDGGDDKDWPNNSCK